MAQSRSRFEYKFTDLHGGTARLREQMNELGAEGWEVASFENHSQANYWILWKREIIKDEFDDAQKISDQKLNPGS